MVRSSLRAHFKSKEEFDLELDRIERSLELEEYLRDAPIRVMNAALARYGWRQDGAGKPVYIGHEG
jgi:hypothetical protein